MQETSKGHEIPVPTWGQVMGDLKKAAEPMKPVKPLARLRRPKK